MELILFTILLALSILFAGIGLFSESVNPYLVLFSSMLLFIASMGAIAEGIEIPTGVETIQLNMSTTQINGSITDVQVVQTGLRTTGINIILLLLSLYLAFLGIGEIISSKYGKSTEDD